MAAQSAAELLLVTPKTTLERMLETFPSKARGDGRANRLREPPQKNVEQAPNAKVWHVAAVEVSVPNPQTQNLQTLAFKSN